MCAGGAEAVWERFMYLLEAFLSASSLTAPSEELSGKRERENFFRSGVLLIVEREEGKIIFSEKLLLRHPHPSHSPRNIFLAVV